jgi:hypothetical protein
MSLKNLLTGLKAVIDDIGTFEYDSKTIKYTILAIDCSM